MAALSLTVKRRGQHEQIENPDVAVQIERAFDLGEIIGADERLLIRQQRRDDGHATKYERDRAASRTTTRPGIRS